MFGDKPRSGSPSTARIIENVEKIEEDQVDLKINSLKKIITVAFGTRSYNSSSENFCKLLQIFNIHVVKKLNRWNINKMLVREQLYIFISGNAVVG